jgi:small subunit ribosomal protein S7e
VLVLAFVASTSGAAGGVIEGPVAARAVRSLGLRGGREQTTHRKAFEENKEAADVILRDWIKKEAQPPTALESLLADALYKQSTEDSMKFLKYLHIMSAREVTVAAKGERAIVIFVPFTEMKEYRKMCPALTETLEDQLKAHVFLVAHRRIIRKERRGKALYKQKRPHSRTIAKVHEAYLDDVIWPQDVVGQKSVRIPRIYTHPRSRLYVFVFACVCVGVCFACTRTHACRREYRPKALQARTLRSKRARQLANSNT